VNKSIAIRTLGNGVVVEFFDQSNRYYGDFYRVRIIAVATVPLTKSTLPEDLSEFAATYPDCVKYEKSLDRMGVVSTSVEHVVKTLIDEFIESVGCYLEKRNFAENLLRKDMLEDQLDRKVSIYNN